MFIIPRERFNHGGTRNLGIEKSKGDILVYLTQDATPLDADNLFNLVNPLQNNKNIAMVYGRQLPYPQTNIFGEFARLFNYGTKNIIKSLQSRRELGIKTVFASNSFAAYKKNILQQIGGFPTDVILGEDTYVAAKFLLSGYEIGYIADACVYHSHDYTIKQEFKRYFDIGVFHRREKWIIENFAKAEGEGLRYLTNEIKFIMDRKKFHLIPELMIRTIAKYVGYKLGTIEHKLPNNLKRKLSMHRNYWIN